MNALAQPAAPIAQSVPTPLLRTLVLCDLVGSTALTERLGDQRAADLFRKHDRLARALLPIHDGREIDKTDGFLLIFERPVQAVAFALDYQRGLRELNVAEGSTLAARIGIHVGDLVAWDNSPDDIARGAKPIEVEGLVKPITSRLMQLALPNQILLSGVAHALAHRAQGELGKRLEAVRWRTHGRYRFKGIPDPIPVFEVGEEGCAPLKAPPWSGKAHREVPFWRRPATLGIEIFVLMLLLALPAWYLLAPAPAIAFAQRDWVVVGDLKNLTGDTRFDDSVEIAFRIGLEQSRYVNVLSDLKTRETVQLMQQDPDKTTIDRAIGSEVALRDGARALILPTVSEIGGRVRVTAEVVDPGTQTTVWSESADGAGASSVLPSLDKVNQKLRVRLGEALATVSNESKALEKVATKNLDALRAYSLGVAAYGKGDFKQAIALYTQAVQWDPDFALARLRLGDTLAITGAGDTTQAVAEIRRAAVGQGDRLSARDALYAQAWLANFENPRAALQKWQLLAKLYPDFTLATGALGYFSYTAANRFDAAIAATELNAVATNPHRANGDYLLATLYLGSERYVDAQHRFDSAIANGFSTQGIYNAYLYAAQRQFERAEKTLAAGKKTGIEVDDAQTLYPAIALALDRGNWETARAAVTSAQNATAKMKGTLHAEFTLLELGLRTLAEPEDALKPALAGYLRTLESSMRDTPDAQFNLLFFAYLASHAGHADLAKAALSHVTPLSRSGDYPYLSSLLVIVDADLARINGNPQQAVALLKAHIDGSEYYFSHRVLMDAYAAQHDYANALIEAQWLSQHRGRAYAEQFGQDMLRPFNVALSDLALLDAAELSVRLKKRDAARSSLDDLRKAWPRTDQIPFLQNRLRALDAALPSKPSAS